MFNLLDFSACVIYNYKKRKFKENYYDKDHC